MKKKNSLSTLKTSGKKTVNVEVRKKRTYVKRDPAEIAAEAAEAEKKAAEEAAAEACSSRSSRFSSGERAGRAGKTT